MLALPEDRYAEVEGHRIRYWDTGSGPPVLLIHGLGNAVVAWRENVRALARRFRVLALDLPGHGLSDMPSRRYTLPESAHFLAEFLRVAGVETAHVMGSSMGGIIALEFALCFPEKVRSLVLVDSAGLGREAAGFLRIGSLPMVGELFERPTPERIERVYRALVYDPRTITPDLIEEMHRYRSRNGATPALLHFLRVGVGLLGQRRRIIHRDRLPELGMPLLTVWGRQDPLFPASHAAVALAAPLGRAHIFDRCGHWPQAEHAEEFNRLVIEFASDAEARRLASTVEARAGRRPLSPSDLTLSQGLGSRVQGPGPDPGPSTLDPRPWERGTGRPEAPPLQREELKERSGGEAAVLDGRDADEEPPPSDGTVTAFWFNQRYLRLVILALVLAIIATAFFERDRFTNFEEIVRTLGYPAIFLLSIIGAGAIIIPLPSTAAVFFSGAFLVPLYVGLLAGLGEAIGEITGYALGYSGQGIVDRSRLYKRVEGWVEGRGGWAIVVFSAIPNPIFDLLGIAAGVLRFPLPRFLFYAWIGKTVKNIGLAYAGAVGASWVAGLFGVGD